MGAAMNSLTAWLLSTWVPPNSMAIGSAGLTGLDAGAGIGSAAGWAGMVILLVVDRPETEKPRQINKML